MNRKDIILAALVIISWGVHLPVIKIGTHELSGLWLLTLRLTLTGLFFLPFCKNLSREQLKHMALFSLFFYVGNLGCLFVALKLLPSATVALLIQMQVPFAMIIGWLLYKERIGWKTFSGLAISFIGLFLIFGSPDITSIPGLILTMCCCMSWAIGSARLRYIKEVDMPTMMAYSCLLSAPITFVMTLIFESNQIQQLMTADWTKLSLVFVYQIVLMSLASYIWKQLLSRNPVQYVTSFALLQPIAGVVSAHFLLGEVLSSAAKTGGFLALIGVAIIIFRKIEKAKAIDPEAFSHSD